MLSSFIASTYQAAIAAWVSAGKGSASVRAVAGSGKTTTIGYALTFVPQTVRVLVTTFGKKASTALQSKVVETLGFMPNLWRCATLNSVGFAPIRARLKAQGKRIVLHGAKDFRGRIVPDKSLCIIWDMFPKGSNGKRPAEYFAYGNFVKRLVSLAKNEGVGTLVPNETSAWQALIAKQGLFLSDRKANEERAIEIAQDVLRTSNDWALEGKLDFDDQLYLVALWDLPLDVQAWVIVDEAQDTNRVQLDMIKRMSNAQTRHLFFGDDRQSIYAFRGADSAAIEAANKMFNCIMLKLSVCYRCAKAQVAEANKTIAQWYAIKAGREYNPETDVCNEVEACEGAPEGKVETLETYSASNFEDSDAILCRNTAPLVKLAYNLIRAGKACHILGRNIGDGLIDLIRKMDAPTIDKLQESLREYQARETDRLLDRGREAECEALNDRCDCVRLFIDGLTETQRTVEALVTNIESLFSDTKQNLTLATIHKAKGLEYPRVYILDVALLPSKYATQLHQLEQEYNLLYVARTRARLETYYVTSDGFTGNSNANADDDGESEALEIESEQE